MQDVSFCPQFHHAVELIGRRWTGVIVRALMGGAVRFSDVSASIPGLSDRLLSERLKELESEGIVQRLVYPDTPVRIEYRLTEKGLALSVAIADIAAWAERWGAQADDDAANRAGIANEAKSDEARLSRPTAVLSLRS
ncbi:MAG: helix-turn-helix transcriptional regulator [Chloroflexota bacterium]|nr:helix-turn-helix transcriptional regulator [Chloroflexota bacterium]